VPLRDGLLRAVRFTLLCSVVAPSSSGAECVRLWKTLDDAARASTLVFSGRVTGSSDTGVSFDVDRVWKGDVQQQLTIAVAPGMESHPAAFFKQGESYVVFARRSGRTTPTYDISLCSPTALASTLEKDITQLGPAKHPRRE
jgi:hypothetical protein